MTTPMVFVVIDLTYTYGRASRPIAVFSNHEVARLFVLRCARRDGYADPALAARVHYDIAELPLDMRWVDDWGRLGSPEATHYPNCEKPDVVNLCECGHNVMCRACTWGAGGVCECLQETTYADMAAAPQTWATPKALEDCAFRVIVEDSEGTRLATLLLAPGEEMAFEALPREQPRRKS